MEKMGKVKRDLSSKIAKKALHFVPFDNGRLRLVVSRSNKNLFAQITDKNGRTLLGASTLSLGKKGMKKTEESFALGEKIAQMALELGIKKVFLDRRGARYHGRIKSFAEGARKGGLIF